MLTISELNIYPIKSIRGISVNSANVTDRGFKHDRRWMLIDHFGNFMTQREYPQMAFINVEIEAKGLNVYHRNKKNLGKYSIPFNILKSKTIMVPIWDDTCAAILVGKEADKWFSKALDVECRLVYQPFESRRLVDKKYAKEKELVSFADGYPFLIIGQASLDDLNSKLDEPLPMNRFRPNIVFTGGEPYQEDNMKNFRVGDITFHGVKPCERCSITTTNQDTAERLYEPLKTLATYRKFENKVLFGMNLLNEGFGEVKVGDIIEIF
jgi:MOSC domain-containing protein